MNNIRTPLPLVLLTMYGLVRARWSGNLACNANAETLHLYAYVPLHFGGTSFCEEPFSGG